MNIIKELIDEYGISKAALCEALEISYPTLQAKYKGGKLKEYQKKAVLAKWGGLLDGK